MKTVRELLQTKGSQIWSVTSDSSIFEAAKRMADHNIGALLVVDSGQITGILSERDCVQKVAARGKSCKDTSVREAMTTDVISVDPDESLDECTSIMLSKGIRHLPVVQGGKPIGMVSLRDVVSGCLAETRLIMATCEANQVGKLYDL
jgi:signal-transduction protein with cAMP-binding, CBS, and nucleotidyltransferase domain